MKTLLAFGFAVVAGTANAAPLYNNGPAVDGNGLRVVQNLTGLAAGPGFNAGIADDFTVTDPAGWIVQSLDLFAYTDQNTSSDPTHGFPLFEFADVRWTIVAGDDVNNGEIIASDTTSVTNGGILGFNVHADDTGSRRDAIFDIKADIPDVALDAGHYWLTWSFDSYLTAIQAPVSGEPAGNGMNTFRSSVFQDRGVEFPFELNGVANSASIAAVPEPTTLASMLGGLAAIAGATIRRRSRSCAGGTGSV